MRWSGPEPKLRVMVEGDDAARIQSLAERMIAAAREDLA
ncbi:MAG: hypothetical protein U0326_44850 [Polyangiales bacterium]